MKEGERRKVNSKYD